jgi:hypothetical protein
MWHTLKSKPLTTREIKHADYGVAILRQHTQ